MNNISNPSLNGPENSSCRFTLTPAKFFLLLFFIAVGLGIGLLPYASFQSAHKAVEIPAPQSVNVSSGDELIFLLKEKGLWEISGRFAVPRMILASYPANIGSLETAAKKKAFLNSLLPAALVVMAEVEKEKESLHAILAKIPGDNRKLVISTSLDTWAGGLSKQEVDFLMILGFKYRTDLAEELIKRVDVIPLSLLMSQAALESSWGSSRIAREGNNLFGVQTWGDDAIAQSVNASGSGHRYADYDSIMESIQAYVVMLNRLPSYAKFREIRTHSQDPLALAEGLKNYSERRRAYIVDIKEVIVTNDLSRYDECFLAVPPPVEARKVGLLDAVARRFNLDTPPALI